MANQWFRLYSEFAHDPKVQMLSEVNQRRLIMLFCFRCNDDVTLQDEEVTFQLRITPEEWVKTKEIFLSKGFINSDNEILNWDKRQFISDSSSVRVAKYREKKKQESNVTVTPQNRTDTEQNRTEQKKYIPPIPTDLLADYLKVRKAKKAGELTERSFKAIEREAKLSGISVEQAIIICCERSWITYKDEWNKKPQSKSFKEDTMAAARSIFTNSSGIPYYQAKEIEVKNDE